MAGWSSICVVFAGRHLRWEASVPVYQGNILVAFNTFATQVSKYSKSHGGGPVAEPIVSPWFLDLIQDMLKAVGAGGLTVFAEEPIPGVGVPDFSVYRHQNLLGHIELKAPGKGANPEAFRDRDAKQWKKFKDLPNLVYSDGMQWSMWRYGEQVGNTISIGTDILRDSKVIDMPVREFQSFFDRLSSWHFPPITSIDVLVKTQARHCRVLRDSVYELMDDKYFRIASQQWRKLLFPGANDVAFSDAYAQTVTFALLSASAKDTRRSDENLDRRLMRARAALSDTQGLLSEALEFLTAETLRERLTVPLEVLLTMYDTVDWAAIRQTADTNRPIWLHFYEEFLAEYDPKLRKQSGSYYTPIPIVKWMVRFVNEVITTEIGDLEGLTSSKVKVLDPATGTGTYLIQIAHFIAEQIREEYKKAQVAGALGEALDRLIGFEIQAGPYAVTQLRLVESLRSLGLEVSSEDVRVYLTDTLSDPEEKGGGPGHLFPQMDASGEKANRVKQEDRIVVVIGNPPYKEKAISLGSWVVNGTPGGKEKALIDDWRFSNNAWFLEQGDSKEPKWTLHNLYVYFWRWASWKVFENATRGGQAQGIVSFITPTGFLSGPAFHQMRVWLREKCSHIWVVHLTPEGHHAPADQQVFGAMRQSVGIVTALSKTTTAPTLPAKVWCYTLKRGSRGAKFKELDSIHLHSKGWRRAVDRWNGPFIPKGAKDWVSMPTVWQLFPWHGNGSLIGRKWVAHPRREVLGRRWEQFVTSDTQRKAELLAPEAPKGRAVQRLLREGMLDNLVLPTVNRPPLAEETNRVPPLKEYAFRTLDSQWIISDKRLINRPNDSMWAAHDEGSQLYLCRPQMQTENVRPLVAFSAGQVVTFTDLIPDVHHLGHGGGRVHPLWRHPSTREPNVPPGFLAFLSELYEVEVTPEDLIAYVAAVTAHPGYTITFREHLRNAMELRFPLTAERSLFLQAIHLGRTVLWLHTYGRRYAQHRESNKPSVKADKRPELSVPIPPDQYPTHLDYDSDGQRLILGTKNANGIHGGIICNVTPAVRHFYVLNKNVIDQWFRYRKSPNVNKSSPWSENPPAGWPWEYTRQLLDLLSVLTLLTSQHSEQQSLLEDVLRAPMITIDQLESRHILPIPESYLNAPPAYKASTTLPVPGS